MADHGTVTIFSLPSDVVKNVTNYSTEATLLFYGDVEILDVDDVQRFPVTSYFLAGGIPPLSPPTVGQLWPRGDHITGA